MDLLSETLLSLKIKNMLIGTYHLSAPWGFSSQGFDYGFSFNVIENSCWITPEGEEPIELHSGDSFIFPRGGPMSLSSDHQVEIHPVADVWNSEEESFIGFEQHPPGAYYETHWGGGGEKTRLLSLVFEIEEQSRSSLFNALPHFLVLRKHECQEFHLIRSALYAIAQEKTNMQPGEYAIRNHISEALLVSQLRAHVAQTHYSSGLLAAIKDPYLQPLLIALHKTPQKKWSVELMAKEAGLSRTAFAKRFNNILDNTPMNYLHQHRMELAATKLKETQANVETIAQDLGYANSQHFRKHFLRTYQQSPSAYRNSSS
ncbi:MULTISPECIES: AraC family transcriptional regulator [Marinomonas]|uniref:AraC family transcriptional regulator n=2 Tax=Marinomonas TaxID=28253 RepID=A0A366D1X3_9GAMM|nr:MULTISPECIES: AraC family transcriptional regulator [Marinomonas]AEF55431.1 transcriptional regulator, AraC family [Marinomonas posidonica IVIA-Po-181]RBO84072.1 AraC family transcriptional regulator [Marinomonas aquiplantarum]